MRHNNDTLDSNDISSFWYRRGRLALRIVDCTNGKELGWRNFIIEETEDVARLIMYSLTELKGIGNYENNRINKLQVLSDASKIGLIIPSTTLTTSRQELLTISRDGSKITKAIRNGVFETKDIQYTLSTVIFNAKKTANWPDSLHPILTQELLDKKYELRIFYLDGDFYTSAIFSQNDEQTKVDFRNYNNAKPNRTPPFQLPMEVQEKLHKLMLKLTIKCGSIDMVVTTKNEFIFLEVNPVGQYAQVSTPTNYPLSKVIAEYLSN